MFTPEWLVPHCGLLIVSFIKYTLKRDARKDLSKNGGSPRISKYANLRGSQGFKVAPFHGEPTTWKVCCARALRGCLCMCVMTRAICELPQKNYKMLFFSKFMLFVHFLAPYYFEFSQKISHTQFSANLDSV